MSGQATIDAAREKYMAAHARRENAWDSDAYDRAGRAVQSAYEEWKAVDPSGAMQRTRAELGSGRSYGR